MAKNPMFFEYKSQVSSGIEKRENSYAPKRTSEKGVRI
jgi:hypothetical protein